MKIAYCIGALNLGGIGTVANNLSQYFIKRGDQFHIITTHHKGNFYNTAKDLNWPVKDISNSEIALKKRMKTTLTTLLSYDVVINNHSDEVLFILPALPRSIIKISVQHNTTIKSSKRLSFNANYLNFSAGVSPAVTSVMRIYHNQKDKIIVLPNGVSKVTTKTYSSKASVPLKLLYVGRLDDNQKNIFVFPKILKALEDSDIDATLTLAGSGDHREELKRRFLELDLSKNFNFVGRVSSTDLANLFKSHDFILNLSHWEGLPMVVLEAMSAGVIPILSSIEPHRYALGTILSEQLVSSDNSINAFVTTIKGLYHKSVNYIELSEGLMYRWETRFSIDAFGENYNALIERAKESQILDKPVSFKKIRLPLKDRYKTTAVYTFAQKLLRRTK